MAGIRQTLLQLAALRRKFQTLLATEGATRGSAASGAFVNNTQNPLTEHKPGGSNPGELRMYAHVPDVLPKKPALVVALHGCSQDARQFDRGTGWSTLADRYGFVVVYPEQQPGNNPKSCFSWFQPGDSTRGRGEAQSIYDMVEYAIATFGIDRGRVFITGLSAGGAMTSVMLATYPEVFAGGAIIAGLPHGAASSVQEAFQAMFTDQRFSAESLGDRVRAASSHRGPWPRISVWHGTGDRIVRPSNADQIVAQWSDVHGLPSAHSEQSTNGVHTRRVWNDEDGQAVIESITVADMAHGVPLASRDTPDACGAHGPFFLDAGISSTWHIAELWGLADRASTAATATWTAATEALLPKQPALAAVHRTEARAEKPDRASSEERTRPGRSWNADPSSVIARAFKAAGLPTPEVGRKPEGGGSQITPQSIIDAALKAAGLRQR